MDIVCAQRLYLPDGAYDGVRCARVAPRCTMALTAPGVVGSGCSRIGGLEPTGESFRLCEIAPGWTVDEVQALTGAPLVVSDELREFQL